ncbi:FAD-dependent monooxygenase [Jannaschia sp. S6380]|uniref:FAD-dependent monooxygenase n=1 Tax=Jannaschia sp. S6380 TaxID=2926408 RepID=UPI001FF56C59|nr:FAD-dependent monooxygenase [Jannaschia sp. S6380]
MATTDAADVTVLGGGVAGLACAIACVRSGLAVTLLEQAPALTEVGAGLQIAPNGGRVLDALGVDPPAIDNRAVHLIDGPTGRTLIRMPLGDEFRLIHRADLIDALANRARAAGVDIHLNTQVVALRDDGRALMLADGTSIAARRVVGADGVRGAARRFVAPGHQPRYTGQVAWRAIVPVDAWPGEAQVHVGPGRHLVCYPLRDGRSLNIVAVEERAAWAAEGWSHRDDPAALRRAFAGFARPVRGILDRVEDVHLWGLMDHGATPAWSRGVCTLIGDAAHPTLPFLAQGANLALEDGWTLAAMLDRPAAWEARRRPRVARALRAAQRNAANYHLTGPRRRIAHAALRIAHRIAPAAPLRGYAWLYDHDVTHGDARRGDRAGESGAAGEN